MIKNDTKQNNDVMIHVLWLNDVVQKRKWLLKLPKFFFSYISCTVNVDWI